jgi:hypothetical protein
MGLGFEQSFFLNAVRCVSNGAQIPSACREILRWDSSKPCAASAANAWTPAPTAQFGQRKISAASIIPDASAAAPARINVFMAHWSDTANP